MKYHGIITFLRLTATQRIVLFAIIKIKKEGNTLEYIPYNPNPTGKNVGDCTVRAISKALNKTWEEVYVDLVLQGFMMGDMPSANAVWGAYLKKNGFVRKIIPDICPDCYTMTDFSEDHPFGIYILALSGHVVCIKDGTLYDSWDSSGEIPLYFWYKE